MIRKQLTAITAAGILGAALIAPTSADARNGRIAAGILGGLAAGAIIGSMMADPYYGPGPYYYGPPPGYYYGPRYYVPYGYYAPRPYYYYPYRDRHSPW